MALQLNADIDASQLNETSRNYGVDAVRIFAVLAVIFIHMPNVDAMARWINIASRWAVPFFFAAAGYFAGSKERSVVSETRRVLVRLGVPYIFWVCVYLVLLSSDFATMSVRDVGRVILFGGPAIHLWFVPSLGLCLILLRTVWRWPVYPTLVLASILYGTGLLMGAYIPDGYTPMMNSRNGPFFGFLLVCIGYYYRMIKPFSGVTALGGLIVAFAAYLVEVHLLHTEHIDQLLTTPAVGLFCLAAALKIPDPIARLLSKFGKYAFGMYLVHLGILTTLVTYFVPTHFAEIGVLAIATLLLSLITVMILWSIRPLQFLVR